MMLGCKLATIGPCVCVRPPFGHIQCIAKIQERAKPPPPTPPANLLAQVSYVASTQGKEHQTGKSRYHSSHSWASC